MGMIPLAETSKKLENTAVPKSGSCSIASSGGLDSILGIERSLEAVSFDRTWSADAAKIRGLRREKTEGGQ